MRSCASNCKIVHLCRALPPRDSIPFATQFDSILRKGFESILGHELEERWWRIARLPVKYGGVGLRSGVTTAAAQYAMSVMKTEHHVKDIAGQGYDAKTVLERDAKEALEKALGEKEGEMATVDLDELLENGGRAKVDNLDLSLSQRCEAAEFNRIFEAMSQDEKDHILAHSGKDHHWLRVAPLHWRNFRLKPNVFVTSLKRRLRLPVYTHASEPGDSKCCRGGTRDIFGDHALNCKAGNGAQANTRHNAIARLVAEAARQAGFSVELEHSGGLRGSRPGDVFIRNFEGGVHMLLDVSIVDPLCASYKKKLTKPGAVATWRQQNKVSKYKRQGLQAFGLDDPFQFCPFLIESTGGFGEEAEKLCKKLRQIRRARNSNAAPVNEEKESERDGLKEAISVELQRQQAAAILEREPPALNPTLDEIEFISADIARREDAAQGNRRHDREIREDTQELNPRNDPPDPPDEKLESPPQPNTPPLTNTPIPPQTNQSNSAGRAIYNQHASLPVGPQWTAIPPPPPN